MPMNKWHEDSFKGVQLCSESSLNIKGERWSGTRYGCGFVFLAFRLGVL